MQHIKQMNFGMSETIDRILFEEIDLLPVEEQVVKLKQEFEAVLCEKYDLLNHVSLLQSHINKISDNSVYLNL